MNAVAQRFLEPDLDSRETRESIGVLISAGADAWSCPELGELRRGGFDSERSNGLYFKVKEQRNSYFTRCLAKHDGPVFATTDYLSRYASNIRASMPDGRYHTVLRASGYVRNESHPSPRHSFEITRRRIARAAVADRAWHDDFAGRREHHRDLKTRSGLLKSVDRVSADMQRHVLAGRAMCRFHFS